MKKMTALCLALLLLAGSLPIPGMAAEALARKRLQEMTLREKIAQMLMVEIRHWDEAPDDDRPREDFTVMNEQVRQILKKYPFGGVILFSENLKYTEQIYTLTHELQASVGEIPLLICADQEGGSVYRLSTGTALPGNMALGAAGAPEYARLAGRILGSELSALGINTNLAPVADVNSNPNNPVIGLRSFGDNARQVGTLAAAVAEGMHQFDVIACAKHFPGHGDTETDSHYGLPVVDKSLDQLRQSELIPFQTMIEENVDMIMTAHILYPQLEQEKVLSRKTAKEEALPATMSPRILTELLKEEMGFSGIVVTDAMNMAGIVNYWDPVQAVVQAIQAGADMICMPCRLENTGDLKQLEAIIRGVEAAVEDGTVPLSRIEDAVFRILSVKEHRGLLRNPGYSLERALDTVGGSANREAERHLAAAAVTVVENKNSTLPLRLTEESRVLMLVPYKNEKAQMLLGWNRAVQAGQIPEGAQVKAVRFSAKNSPEYFRQDLNWADTLIFNSEVSQASQLSGNSWHTRWILQATEIAKEQGKTVIVQSVEKPYDIQCYPDADAVLAVYGCKGSSLDPTQVLLGGSTASQEAFGPNITAGIEVIFGVFGAQGTLPVDIPQYEDGAFTRQILYPRGYGLHYDSLIPQPEIPEETEQVTEPVESTVPETVPEAQEAPAETVRPLWPVAVLAVAAIALLLRPRRPRRRRRRR